jgi:adenylylsulfate kinase
VFLPFIRQSQGKAMTPAPDNSRTGEMTLRDRERLLGQRGCVIWLTGFSGSGKTTIARALERRLMSGGRLCCVLDGDAIRKGLNRDLGFSPEDRAENIRRAGEIAALFMDAGVIVAAAFISPYRDDRARARECVPSGRFIEVYLSTTLETCEKRDTKGFYAGARQGTVDLFTGISAPYEPPLNPELVFDTTNHDAESCVDEIMKFLQTAGILFPPDETAP